MTSVNNGPPRGLVLKSTTSLYAVYYAVYPQRAQLRAVSLSAILALTRVHPAAVRSAAGLGHFLVQLVGGSEQRPAPGRWDINMKLNCLGGNV